MQVLDWDSFSVELGFGVPIYSGILDSLTWAADSKAHDFGSNKQKFSGFRNPKEKIPGSRKLDFYLTWGEIWFIEVKKTWAKETSWRGQTNKQTNKRDIVMERFSNKNRKGIGIAESGKFLLVESGILGFGIRNTAQGTWNHTNDWNSKSKFHWQRLESSRWNPESAVCNP